MREGRVNLVPFETLPWASGSPHLLELRDAELGDLAVRIDETTVSASKATGNWASVIPSLAQSSISSQNRARCVGDVDLTTAELLEPPPVPEMPTVTLISPDRLLEIFCDSLGDRVHGAGAVNT